MSEAIRWPLAANFLDRGDQATSRHRGLLDPRVTRRAAAVEQPLEGRLRLDEGAFHSPQRALAYVLPQRPADRRGGVVGVGHAQDSEAVPLARQARTDAEQAPAGGLPAVASFW